MHIDEIRTGGQSGADRAAFDVARLYNIPICGWCPKGGWAEDMPEPPGLLAVYPEMIETPSDGTIQRTEWNIRDSSVCIVFDTFENTTSPGTDAGGFPASATSSARCCGWRRAFRGRPPER